MPPKGKRSGKSSKSKSYAKKRYYGPRATPRNGIVGNTKNANVLNTLKPAIYRFKDTINFNDIVGTGASVQSANIFHIGMVGRYSALIAMFRKYRITSAKWRFRLRTVELTDQAQHPVMLLRWNYDPDLVQSSISENQMLRLQNVVHKQFIHNTPDGCNLEYTIMPAVMGARQIYSTGLYKPSPMFRQWCDFTQDSLNEITHYGIQSFITNLPTGQTIDVDLQLSYECCDLI